MFAEQRGTAFHFENSAYETFQSEKLHKNGLKMLSS